MKQIKSKKRVADFGEVFTNEREVKAMCDLVEDETQKIGSRFLEPACGEGVFLIEIITRKLEIITKKYKKQSDWEKLSLLALSSLYGIDILADNCKATKENLFNVWNSYYNKLFNSQDENVKHSAKKILNYNIINGNTLTMHLVDKTQKDTGEYITFQKWLLKGDVFLKVSFSLIELLENNGTSNKEKKVYSYYYKDIK